MMCQWKIKVNEKKICETEVVPVFLKYSAKMTWYHFCVMCPLGNVYIVAKKFLHYYLYDIDFRKSCLTPKCFMTTFVGKYPRTFACIRTIPKLLGF